MTYSLQNKPGEKDAVWQTIPGTVTATGPTASIDDPVQSDGVRLYRVKVVER